MDADGYADLVVGAPARLNPTSPGQVFGLFGASSIGVVHLSTEADFVLSGETFSDGAGWSVAVGDHDGDGYDDVAGSTPYRNTDQGKVYLLFGSGI